MKRITIRVRFYACGKMYKTNSQELRIVGPKQLMIEAMNIQAALLTLDVFCCIRYLTKQCANISAKLKAAVVLRWKQEIRRHRLSSFGAAQRAMSSFLVAAVWLGHFDKKLIDQWMPFWFFHRFPSKKK